jgi:rRNA maturation endonuclease Nob1
VIYIKANRKKLRFCFYCGSLKPELKENEEDICHYCGVNLPYNSIKKKKENDFFI